VFVALVVRIAVVARARHDSAMEFDRIEFFVVVFGVCCQRGISFAGRGVFGVSGIKVSPL
jgi:hypothetical protein